MKFHRVLDSRLVLLFAFLMGIVVSAEVNLTLPELHRYEYNHTPENYITKNKQRFTEDFGNILNPNVSITSTNESLVRDCSFIPMSIEPRDLFEIKLNTLEGNIMGSFIADMIIVKSQKLVYTVTNKLTITAYSYADNELKKLVSKDLDYELNASSDNIDNSAIFAITHDENALYLFTKRGSYLIDTKTILEKIKHFPKEFDVEAQSAAVLGEHIILVGPMVGMRVYRVRPDYTLEVFKHIERYEREEMVPNSIVTDEATKLVYVLGQSQNIYIFSLWNDQILPYDIIEFQHVLNFMIRLDAGRIYYSFVDGGTMKIAELEYNPEIKSASLIRYYKMFDYIYDFKVFSEQMFALTQETLEIAPTNVDPRIITKQHNGVRLQLKARKMAAVTYQTFIFINQQSLKLVRLRTHNSRLECKFLSEHGNTIDISIKSNMSHCDNSPKPFFNSYCEISRSLSIKLDIPEESERQKTLLYSGVVFVTVLFVVGLVCLIQWRNGRLDLIDKLAYEIRQFRSRERQQRPQPLHQENQIEIPQVATERDEKRDSEDNV